MHTCKLEYDGIIDGYRVAVTVHEIADVKHRFPELETTWRCGYVRLPKDHPYWGLAYDEIDVDCHGGLTYGDMNNIALGYPVECDGHYWIGFDCNHLFDTPEVCTLEFCRKELQSLVEQLKERQKTDIRCPESAEN